MGRLLSCLGIFLFSFQVSFAGVGVQKRKFESGSRYLAIEVLTDQSIHFELSENRGGPSPDCGIYLTPMIYKSNYPGPEEFYSPNPYHIETRDLRLDIDPATLSLSVFDKRKGVPLTEISGVSLDKNTKRLRIDPKQMQNVYGLGNFFYDPKVADGDWSGRDWNGVGMGNVRKDFSSGTPSMSQFPVLYALGPENQNFGLFMDQPYKMNWNFRDPKNWFLEMWGDQVRGYVFAGSNIKELRRQFMDLVGKPPVPPKSTFGLWVSKFGYENWGQIQEELQSLRRQGFPVDGFALDLQWFGAKFFDDNVARMGSLQFDESHFPNPAQEVKRLKEDGIELMPIEESYVDMRLRNEWQQLTNPMLLAHWDNGAPVILDNGNGKPRWWGMGGMIDWSNPEARARWHEMKRRALSEMGIHSHWADLGEPEMYEEFARYFGDPKLPGKNQHGDLHNLYALYWMLGIFEGYRKEAGPFSPRHFTLSRAGAPGIQRFGAGMWSGDIGRDPGSLVAHLNTTMHMSLAGMDYYSSDVGGFEVFNGQKPTPEQVRELYTQWFASNALGEIPLRPHGWAYGEPDTHFGPDRRGDGDSNRANLLLRYKLHPYVYSLAHMAYLYGEPIFPPLVYHFQEDPNTRGIGSVKMIGESLVYGIIAGFGHYKRSVYLPRGKWFNFHTLDSFESSGQETPEIPAYLVSPDEKALFTLPLFARAGAIIPMMLIDDQTLNLSGKRKDGSIKNDLGIRVFSDPNPTSFTLFEDDGKTLGYEPQDSKAGEVRKIKVEQWQEGNEALVIVHAAEGSYSGAPSERPITLELVFEGKLIVIKTGNLPVNQDYSFRIPLQRKPKTTAIHFRCNNANTAWGEAIYITGNIPELGSWDPGKAIKLSPSFYPTWVGTLEKLPIDTDIEWKCIKRTQFGGETVQQWGNGQNNHFRTGSNGFSGIGEGNL